MVFHSCMTMKEMEDFGATAKTILEVALHMGSWLLIALPTLHKTKKLLRVINY